MMNSNNLGQGEMTHEQQLKLLEQSTWAQLFMSIAQSTPLSNDPEIPQRVCDQVDALTGAFVTRMSQFHESNEREAKRMAEDCCTSDETCECK